MIRKRMSLSRIMQQEDENLMNASILGAILSYITMKTSIDKNGFHTLTDVRNQRLFENPILLQQYLNFTLFTLTLDKIYD